MAKLLETNPLRGTKLPTEQNPQRPVMEDRTYAELLGVADDVDWRFRLSLVLTHENGHRQGAIRPLLWSDVDVPERVD